MVSSPTMLLLDQSTVSIPSSNIAPSSLPLVAKLLGFVVSWAASIYFLWVRKPPKVLSDIPFFEQTQRLSIIITSIFLILTWGALGTSRSLSVLITLAIALTVVGIIAYFVTIAWTIKKQQAGAAVVTASPLLMLVVFLIYTSFISCGLTSAGVFLAVLLTNPANSSLGTNLTKPEPLTVTLTVDGKTVVPENEDAPFRITSGQQNFGCEENRNFSVEFSAPQNATLIGQASATFLNFSNAKIAGGPAVNQNATSAAASGVLRGLDYQSFPLGIKNCPGGGHGELVLSGVYRSTVNHEQDVTRILTNDLTTATSEPVWVTLPDFAVSNVKAVCKPKAGLGREYTATVSASQTTSSDGPFQVTYLVDKKQIGLSFR